MGMSACGGVAKAQDSMVFGFSEGFFLCCVKDRLPQVAKLRNVMRDFGNDYAGHAGNEAILTLPKR